MPTTRPTGGPLAPTSPAQMCPALLSSGSGPATVLSGRARHYPGAPTVRCGPRHRRASAGCFAATRWRPISGIRTASWCAQDLPEPLLGVARAPGVGQPASSLRGRRSRRGRSRSLHLPRTSRSRAFHASSAVEYTPTSVGPYSSPKIKVYALTTSLATYRILLVTPTGATPTPCRIADGVVAVSPRHPSASSERGWGRGVAATVGPRKGDPGPPRRRRGVSSTGGQRPAPSGRWWARTRSGREVTATGRRIGAAARTVGGRAVGTRCWRGGSSSSAVGRVQHRPVDLRGPGSRRRGRAGECSRRRRDGSCRGPGRSTRRRRPPPHDSRRCAQRQAGAVSQSAHRAPRVVGAQPTARRRVGTCSRRPGPARDRSHIDRGCRTCCTCVSPSPCTSRSAGDTALTAAPQRDHTVATVR